MTQAGKLSICALAALALTGCAKEASIGEIITTKVTFPDGQSVQAETMLRENDMMRGLMFRDKLDQDRGVILTFTKDDSRPIYTFNVRFPIDVIWIDSSLRIVAIESNIPPCKEKAAKDCRTYGGQVRSRYVLELNGGSAVKHGLMVGQRLEF